ncbi:Predicted phosphoesterase [Cnuella takakiae]|uniref:Predicted phosphoesterase n=1 Tax=Cnuella takakiae TaxID=1302690 RepID=A0A1M4V3J6_9BACT|nr:metallophosphatase domain-containing protein [Cnuella takakiae]OLY92720.1 hypothetical protein BUE76_13090 [Cnuella takakiae]SHE63473.1 Predicted phosphoesterase [Cnuella takakiae]
MQFVAISDTHCRHHNLRLPPGDVLLHTGDITMRGLRSELLDFLLWFRLQPYKHKIFIGGNHDFCLEQIPAPQLACLIPEGVTYLNDAGVSIEGLQIWGSPVSPFHHGWAFNRHRGAHIRRHWQKIPDDTDILLTHTPPFGILDQIVTEKNNGDKDLLKRVLSIQPSIHVFGHIHEAYGQQRKGATRFYNASLMNEHYQLVNQPFSFQLNPKPVTGSA